MTGLECDISLNNQLALRNTKMLRLYSEIDSRVRTLSFVIKHWAQVTSLHMCESTSEQCHNVCVCCTLLK